jgi:hypothetical protein
MPAIHYRRGRNAGTRRVFIAVPTYSGTVGAVFSVSLFEGMQILDAAKISVDLCIQTGNCHVDDARNAMVREFLKTDCDQFIFIDDDVGFDGADLYRLVNCPGDMVAGVYPCKQNDTNFPVMTIPGTELWADAHGRVEVEAVPTGFLKMTRRCINLMVDCFGERKFYGRGQENESPHVILFERTYEGGKRFSGDYAFCRKWRSLGEKIYVLPEMTFLHTGQYAWGGSLADYWRKRHGVESATVTDSFGRIADGYATLRDFGAVTRYWNNPYAMSPEELEAFYVLLRAFGDAACLVEYGSGISTVISSLVCSSVTAFEADPEWAGRVYSELCRRGVDWPVLAGCGKVVDGWYENDYLVRCANVMLVDGPDRSLGGDRSRFLACKNIGSVSAVFVHDMDDMLFARIVDSGLFDNPEWDRSKRYAILKKTV